MKNKSCCCLKKKSCKKTKSRSKFTKEEDALLLELINHEVEYDWFKISSMMGNRNPRQCRDRWFNYLNPALRAEEWTAEEDKILQEKYSEFGPHWNVIAKFLKGRSGNSVRNRYILLSRVPHEPKPPISIDEEENSKGEQLTLSEQTESVLNSIFRKHHIDQSLVLFDIQAEFMNSTSF